MLTKIHRQSFLAQNRTKTWVKAIYSQIRKAKKCGKSVRAKLDTAPVIKTWRKHRQFKKELDWTPPTVSPCNYPRNSEELWALKATSRKGQEEFPCHCAVVGICTPSAESLSTDLWHEQDTNRWCITLQSTVLFTKATRWFKIPKPHWKSLKIRHFEKSTLLKMPFNLLNYSCFWKLYSC